MVAYLWVSNITVEIVHPLWILINLVKFSTNSNICIVQLHYVLSIFFLFFSIYNVVII